MMGSGPHVAPGGGGGDRESACPVLHAAASPAAPSPVLWPSFQLPGSCPMGVCSPPEGVLSFWPYKVGAVNALLRGASGGARQVCAPPCFLHFQEAMRRC